MDKKAIKLPTEVLYEKELKALANHDTGEKPESWKLSPRGVRTFILGSKEPLSLDGEKIAISKKSFLVMIY